MNLPPCEKDPYPVDALPTCNHALSVCQQEEKCIRLYEDFKANCKVRDNRCRMDDRKFLMLFLLRDLCYGSWTNLRKSPMFGCICPNNHMKKRCDRIFSMVNHNPCVGEFRETNASSSTRLQLPLHPNHNNVLKAASRQCSAFPLHAGSEIYYVFPFSIFAWSFFFKPGLWICGTATEGYLTISAAYGDYAVRMQTINSSCTEREGDFPVLSVTKPFPVQNFNPAFDVNKFH
ncbi:hypothetical protein NQ315_016408 [Exocentrus adspersus]|uniref:GDNF/GAS1 domain-containing protein n=1 Tax=Exocentrus adspersus TaxID=1586481 RepID=A0AAV8VPX0_9CUCU|nr:hypothetical protein NQ315_016408 [Exocentrus adspersus]